MRDDRQSGPANPTRGHFFEPQKVRQQTQSLRSPGRRTETALQGRAPRPQSLRTRRTSRAPSRSRCALTARTANFASTLGRRSSIAYVRPLLLPERRRAVITGNVDTRTTNAQHDKLSHRRSLQ